MNPEFTSVYEVKYKTYGRKGYSPVNEVVRVQAESIEDAIAKAEQYFLCVDINHEIPGTLTFEIIEIGKLFEAFTGVDADEVKEFEQTVEEALENVQKIV